MAETIKGINVAIGGDTQGLEKALADVNKAAKVSEAELRQVDKLLKLDPSNVELAAQKEELLGKAVDATKEKLDRLRQVQGEVEKQFASGDISEGQYRAFQREIVKTEQELKRFEEQGGSVKKTIKEIGESMEKAGEKIKGVGEGIKSVGEGYSKGITAPIVGAAGLMFKGAVDASQAQGKLKAQLGATSAEAEKMGKAAQAAWENGFGDSIDEVYGAISKVRMNMGDMSEKDLQGVAQGAMTIAKVWDQDVNEVTAASGVMMKNFGIDGQKALDILTVGFQQGGDFSGELLDTMREYSPQFKSLGLSADQAMAMLISGVKAGAFNMDKIGDSMKEFNLRAQDGSKTTAQAFASIGLNAGKMGSDIASGGDKAQKAFMATLTALSNIKDPLKQNAAGTALFGTQWEDVRKKVIIAMQDGQKGLGDFAGATQKAADDLNNSDPFSGLKSSLREISDAFMPVMKDIAGFIKTDVVPVIKGFADGFKALPDPVKKSILTIGLIVAAIGPLLMIIGQMVIGIGGLITFFGSLSGGITAIIGVFEGFGGVIGTVTGFLGGIFEAGATVAGIFGTIAEVIGTVIGAASGILEIVAIVGAVGAAVYTLYKHWDDVWALLKGFGSWISSAFSGLIDDAINIGGNIVQGLWQGIQNVGPWLQNKVSDFVNGITNTAKSILGIHSPSKVFADIGGNISKGLANGITDGADATKKAITGVVDGLTGAAMNVNVTNGGAQAPAGPQNTVIINNPVPEKADTSTKRALMKLSYLGVT